MIKKDLGYCPKEEPKILSYRSKSFLYSNIYKNYLIRLGLVSENKLYISFTKDYIYTVIFEGPEEEFEVLEASLPLYWDLQSLVDLGELKLGGNRNEMS